MNGYHITRNNNIEKCNSPCSISEHLHFSSLYNAISILGEMIEVPSVNKNAVRKYNRRINYNCGMTEHYEGSRIFRENELKKLLGKGSFVSAFFVDEGDGNAQIQELRDNGVMTVYSYETHKKITVFAPHPNRIMSLYHAVGEFAPEYLIKQSMSNCRKGYNHILR